MEHALKAATDKLCVSEDARLALIEQSTALQAKLREAQQQLADATKVLEEERNQVVQLTAAVAEQLSYNKDMETR